MRTSWLAAPWPSSSEMQHFQQPAHPTAARAARLHKHEESAHKQGYAAGADSGPLSAFHMRRHELGARETVKSMLGTCALWFWISAALSMAVHPRSMNSENVRTDVVATHC